MAYASARFAKGLCDRCGFEYKLLELKKEWNNLKTCTQCFETVSYTHLTLPTNREV